MPPSNAAAARRAARVRFAVRCLPAAVLGFCAWGYAAEAAGLGEPYPALRLPGFAHTRAAGDGAVRTQQLVTRFRFADGSTAKVDQNELTEPFSVGARNIVAGVYLGYHVKNARERRGGERWRDAGAAPVGRVRTLLPGTHQGKRLRDTEEHRLAVIAWLRGRAGDLFPGRTAESVELFYLVKTLNARGRDGEGKKIGPVKFPLDPGHVPTVRKSRRGKKGKGKRGGGKATSKKDRRSRRE